MTDQTTSRDITTKVSAPKEEVYEVINDILRDGVTLTLATVNDTKPWTCSLLYSFDEELNIYWLSKDSARHSKELTENPNVCINICVVEDNGNGRMLQVEGLAFPTQNSAMSMMIEEKYHERHKHFTHKSPQDLIEEAKHFSLYKLEPSKIFVTHEHLWGHDRQEYSLKEDK